MHETKDIVHPKGRAYVSLLGIEYWGFQDFWTSNQG